MLRPPRQPSQANLPFAALVACLAVITLAPAFAETPPGLLTLTSEPEFLPAQRNWERLGIRDAELRLLERFHRGDGYQGWNIAYKSLELNMTGVLTHPDIPVPETPEEQLKFPLVVLSHGSDFGVDARYRAIALDLARRGYVVLAPTFRGRVGPEGRSEGVVQIGRNEVIDLLQLAQLGRKLVYVDSLRIAIIGEGHGATATLLAIERSNVFRAAIVISPLIFSGLAEYGFAGINRLVSLQDALFGRELDRSDLVRELNARDMFRQAGRIRAPMLFIHAEADPSYVDQRRFLGELARNNIRPRVLEFPGMWPYFMTSHDDGNRPANWLQERDRAWDEVFAFIEEHIPPPPEEEVEP
ncbi:MAG: prolyl oligopeptidase family serine peptidase [Acidobacteria bacterium]|nr:prolyl oligopeptidase family serine peptidase [Acidobacteriota bacterium]